ncbi:MAG: Ig-like domain-containing protein, partial [Acidimicrobiales bacterium]
PGGSVELRPDGSFTYTPDQGFSGTDTFTYTATNGRDYSAPATVSIAVGAAPEGVSSVSGGALGYYTNVSLFGGAFETRGPDPSVTLPATGSPQPRAAFSPSGSAVYGPATIFESGPLVVSTGGTTGPGGSSASSASAKAVGPGPLFADSMASTCRSTETGSSGSTTLSGARVRVSMGNDFDSEADDKVVVVPDNPAPNTEVRGAIENVGDSFRVVFNEQVPSPDAITVNAAHMYLEGPTAVGEAIIGQSRCGVVAQAPNTAPSATDDAYTTATGTPLQVSPAGVLANDTDPEADPLTAAKVVPAFPSSPNAGWSFPSDPANGSLTLGPDGSFTYTPNDGFVGTDTFAYRASDPRGAGDEGTVTVTVAPSTTSTTSTTTPTSTTSTTTPTSTTSTTVPPTSKIAPVADFDGDGTTDESIYRPSTGQWFVQGGQVTSWGADGDIPVPGDYDANATTDIAIYRPGTGQWFIQGTTPSVTSWGEAGDIPVPGDYDGNGATDIAIYRPSTGQWFVRGGPVTSWGADGDIPVPGDYDGNGFTDIAIYRPGPGQWFIQGTTASVTSLGDTVDIPVPCDYGADASTDIAIYRPSTGQWFVRGGQVTSWGAGRDIPLPLPYAIQSVFFSQAGSPATTSTTSPATTSTTAAPTTTTTAAPTTTTTAPTTTTTAAPSTTTTSIPPATVPGIPPVTVAGV